MADATDARLSTSLPGHPKTKKLARRLGPAGPLGCIYLFLWTAANRSDGDLSGMTDEDIELAVDWTGDEGVFVSTMMEVGYLEGATGARRVHDWAEHNPWAAGAEGRSEKARWANLCKYQGKAEAARRMPEYAARMHEGASEKAGSPAEHPARKPEGAPDSPSGVQVGKSTTPPSPNPNPLPNPEELEEESTVVDLSATGGNAAADDSSDLLGKVPKKQIPNCPHMAIIELYHEILPEMPGVVSWEEDRRKWLAARWKADPERQNLDWWRAYFEAVRGMPWLMGERAGRDGNTFKCSLEWLIRPKNFAKVIEGTYVDVSR